MKLVGALIVTSLAIIVLSHFTFSVLPSFFYQSIALLFLGTAGIYFYLVDVKKQRPDFFVQMYMATLFVKIIAYGAYVFFVVWEDKIQAANNALIFMITYLLFTAIEIIFLYRTVSR